MSTTEDKWRVNGSAAAVHMTPQNTLLITGASTEAAITLGSTATGTQHDVPCWGCTPGDPQHAA
ncbi:MAG: hypothetical protein AB7O68_00730 [Pirellulales bacterium]